MNDQEIQVAALATMSPKEAMKMLEQVRQSIARNQEHDLQELIRGIAMTANERIEELKASYAEKNVEFIINGVVTIDINDGKISVEYSDNKSNSPKLSKNAIGVYVNNQSFLIGKPMYFNLRGITFEVSLNHNNIWAVAHDDKIITADSPSTLIKRVAENVLGIKSNQSGWRVIKLKGMEDDDNNTEEADAEDSADELE